MLTFLGRVLGIGALAVCLVGSTAWAGDLTLSADSAWAPIAQESESTTMVTSTTDYHPQWVRDIEAKTWKGFLTGMDGFGDFIDSVSMPLYAENPFIRSDVRIIYMYHEIPDHSALGGGDIQVLAAPIRLALCERAALLLWKDGYSWLDNGALGDNDGWNDFGVGLKVALYADAASKFIVSGGLKWEWVNGSEDALQGGDSQELAPFLSFAKAWDRVYLMGSMTARCPMQPAAGNYSLLWNLHLDYALTETFRPLVELNGIHWMSNGDFPGNADYLDVGSLGAHDVAGRDFFSMGLGFRWQALDWLSFGSTYEIPLERAHEHLQEYRLTFNTVLSF